MDEPPAPRHADLAGALAFTAVSLVVLFLQPVSREAGVTRAPDLLAVALVLLATLPLALRRRAPLTVAAVVVPAAIFSQLHGYATGLQALGALFALASAAYLTDRRRSIAIGAYGVVALIVASVVTGGPLLSLQVLVANLASPILAVIAGDVMRGRRAYARRWREYAEEIERLRDADRERAVAEERVRLAREVHDVVGHRLAAITLQARAGAQRIGSDPETAGAALAEIDALAGQALADTRRAVGVIGHDGLGAPTEPSRAA